MAMKKKFLGLALAITMALPMGTAFADTIGGDLNDTLTPEVKITGSVKNSTGQAPAGRLEVELPTTMSFTVDQDGNFKGVDYKVTNNSSVGITVGVSQFKEGNPAENGGIILQTKNEEIASMSRENVKLVLMGDGTSHVDLANQSEISRGTPLLTIKPSGVGVMKLTGDAGKAKNGGAAETNGVKEDFTLIFEIKKQ